MFRICIFSGAATLVYFTVLQLRDRSAVIMRNTDANAEPETSDLLFLSSLVVKKQD